MNNKLPGSDDERDERDNRDGRDDLALRRLLAQSQVEESPELLEGLRRLRSFRAVPAPEPSGVLAAVLQGTVTPLPKRSRRRGIVLSFAVAGAMAAGVSGVAASDEVRRTCESILDAFDQRQQAPVPAPPAEEQPLAESPEQPDVLPGDVAEPTGAAVSVDPSSAGMPAAVIPDTAAPKAPAGASAPIPVSPQAPANPPGGAASTGAPGTGPKPVADVPAVPAPVVVQPMTPDVPDVVPQPVPQPWLETPGRSRGVAPVPHPVPFPPGQSIRHVDDWRGASGAEPGWKGHAGAGRGYN